MEELNIKEIKESTTCNINEVELKSLEELNQNNPNNIQENKNNPVIIEEVDNKKETTIIGYLNKKKEAIKSYYEVIKQKSIEVGTYINKNISSLTLNQKQEELKSFDEAIKQDPNNAKAYNFKGDVLDYLNQKQEAIKCYYEAIKLNKNPLYFCNLGNALNTLYNFEESLTNLYLANNLIQDANFIPSLYNLSDEMLNFTKKYLKSITKITENYQIIEKNIKEKESKGRNMNKLIEEFSELVKTDLKIKENEDKNKQLEEFEKFNKKLEEFNKKILTLEEKVENLEEELKTKLDDLQALYNNEIKNYDSDIITKFNCYYNSFMKTFSIFFVSSQAIISGQLKISNSTTLGSIISTLTSFIPMIGDQISKVVTSLDSLFASSQLITASNNFVRFFNNDTDMNKKIGNILITLIKNETFKNRLLNLDEELVIKKEESTFNKIINIFIELKNKIDIYLYSELYRTPFEKQGNQDANLLIVEILKLKGDPVTDLESYLSLKLIDTTCIVENRKEKTNDKVESSCCCIVF